LAERFAPIQITWMGFPFSSFYHNIDYIIGDKYFDPIGGDTEKYCTEKILRMDPCYMCFALGVDYYINPEPPQTRKGHVTFGMMNNPNKFGEDAVRAWQKCLEAVPNSRLMIKLGRDYSKFVNFKLHERLEKFGLDMNRVDFSPGFDPASYFGAYNDCDVMLDSFPFGGTTTTSEAIWMGVPVIGCQYPMRHGRMAYSFMSNVGLGGLCADSLESYPDKVREVSCDVDLLRDIRTNLRGRLKDTPLYNTEIFRNAFERAMRDVFISYCMKNKSPFVSSIYDGVEGRLLRDCVRAADVVLCELDRKLDPDDNKLSELLREYKSTNIYLMERILDIYRDSPEALLLAEKAAQLLDMIDISPGFDAKTVVIKAIRTILLKFA